MKALPFVYVRLRYFSRKYGILQVKYVFYYFLPTLCHNVSSKNIFLFPFERGIFFLPYDSFFEVVDKFLKIICVVENSHQKIFGSFESCVAIDGADGGFLASVVKRRKIAQSFFLRLRICFPFFRFSFLYLSSDIQLRANHYKVCVNTARCYPDTLQHMVAVKTTQHKRIYYRNKPIARVQSITLLNWVTLLLKKQEMSGWQWSESTELLTTTTLQ